ncbi:hypothetical protein [Massilia niabensis]|uniref:Uncharacterized protein n=1 Tax=Massilia niabensis TaxID=544910 RepID=A0ABW0LAL9_9BURK
MKTEIRVAFVAVRRDPDTGDRQALIFGTAIKGGSETRLVRLVDAAEVASIKELDLDRLHALLCDDADLQTVDPATLRKTFGGTRPTAAEAQVDGLSNAVAFVDVERFVTFKYERALEGQLTSTILPLLVVDAANGPGSGHDGPVLRRSRVSVQFNESTTIKGFSVELFIRLAGNPLRSVVPVGLSNGIIRLRRTGLQSARQRLFDQVGFPHTLASHRIAIGHAFESSSSQELRDDQIVWHAQYDDRPSGLIRFASDPRPRPPSGKSDTFNQPPALLSSIGIVPGDQHGRYEARAFLFERWTMSTGEKTERLVLRLQGRIRLDPDSSRPLIPGFPVDLMDKQPSFELVQRQEAESTFASLFELTGASDWSIQLRPHQDWLRSNPPGLRPWLHGSLEDWVAAWNIQVAREVASALDNVSGRSAMSMLPTFDVSGSSRRRWTVIWVLHGRVMDKAAAQRLVRLDGDPDLDAAFQGFAPHFADSTLLPAAAEARRFRVEGVRIQFQAFRDHSGVGIAYEGNLAAPRLATPVPEPGKPDPSQEVPDGRIDVGWGADAHVDGACGYALHVNLAKLPDKQTSRVGAFALTFDSPDRSNDPEHRKALSFDIVVMPGRPGGRPSPFSGLLSPSYLISGKLPVERIRQVAQDRPEDDLVFDDALRQDPLGRSNHHGDDPLFLTLGDEKPSRASFDLFVFETGRADRDRFLQLQVLFGDYTAPQDVAPPLSLTIMRRPFMVAAAPSVDLGDLLSANELIRSDKVAAWDSSAGRWLVRTPSQRVTLLLPPQAIGEAMEKRRNPERELPENREPPPERTDFDLEAGELADFRYGPATTIVFDPSALDSDYGEPPLNIARLFGAARGRLSGVGLAAADFELLYGLSTHLEPDLVGSRETVARAAELGAYLGNLPPRETGRKHPFWKRANALIGAAGSRLGAIEIAKTDNGARKFDADLTFTLRNNARLRYPLGEAKPDNVGAPFVDDGLAGGVAWPFESGNIIRQVWSQPRSDAGHVDRLSLTALGGFGEQRAEFANGLTIIETLTAMGRVHRYRLERIGRIACLHNRAKHVIVYERSVVPSAQFVNEGPIGETQDTHYGRPVLRKMEEYVELLQPIRRYPESEVTPASAAGPLKASAFRNERIHVDSRWGRDVGLDGWEVPLWRTEFEDSGDPSDPMSPASIYPKPKVDLMVAAGKAELPVEIAQPERLRFFTWTKEDAHRDTDLWPIFAGVDMPPAPEPWIAPHIPTPSPATLPRPTQEAPGWERFTLGLVQGETAVSLADGRFKDGPAVRLANVSISRSAPEQPSATLGKRHAVSSGIQAMLDAIEKSIDDAAREAGARVSTTLERANGDLEAVKGRAVQILARARSAVNEIRDNSHTARENLRAMLETLPGTGAACAAIDTLVDEAMGNFAVRLSSVVDQTLVVKPMGEVDRAVATVRAALNDAASDAEELRAKAIQNVDELASVVRATLVNALLLIRSTVESGLSVITEARDTLTSFTNVSNALKAEIVKIGVWVSAIGPNVLTAQQEAELRKQLAAVVVKAHAASAKVRDRAHFVGRLADAIDALADSARKLIDLSLNAKETADVLGKKLRDIATDADFKPLLEKWRQLYQDIDANALNLSTDVAAGLSLAEKMLLAARKDLEEQRDTILETIGSWPGTEVAALLSAELNRADSVPVQIRAQAQDIAKQAKTAFLGPLESARPKLKQSLCALVTYAWPAVEALDQYAKKLDATVGALDKWIDSIAAEITAAGCDTIEKIEGALGVVAQDLLGHVEEVRDSAMRTVSSVLERVEPAYEKAEKLYQKGDAALRLVRALGDPPVGDGISATRPEVAFGLSVAKDKLGIDVTPAIALVAKTEARIEQARQLGAAAQDLAGELGVSQPFNALTDRIGLIADRSRAGVAEQLEKLQASLGISDIIDSIAGLRDLFPDSLPVPIERLSDYVVTKTDFDADRQVTSLSASIDLQLRARERILNFGPVTVAMLAGKIEAHSLSEADDKGKITSRNDGQVSGTLELSVSDYAVIGFRDTLVRLDNGSFDVQIRPDRLVFADAMQMLVMLLEQVAQGKGIELYPVLANGEDVGRGTSLDMVLPDLSAGAFAISGLSLSIQFEVIVKDEFELVINAAVGTRTAPFVLTVAFLQGGGYLVSTTRYRPADNRLIQTVSIGIVAGAGAGFNFGVASGSVFLRLGVEAEMSWMSQGGGQTIAIVLFLHAGGSALVFGVITISISVMLACRYNGSSLDCSGTLTAEVRLSRFIKRSVRQHITYVLAGSGSGKSSYSKSYE